MLVAFNGNLGSGKDTAAERLTKLVRAEGLRLSFARYLKESAAALFDIPVEDWEIFKNDPEVLITLSVGFDRTGILDRGEELLVPHVIRQMDARELLQRYGTESHRQIFGDNFWVEQAMADYMPHPGTYHYVTDCRFENEAEAVKARSGVVIRVLKGDEPELEWNEFMNRWDIAGTNTPAREMYHPSEIPLPSHLVDFEIDNSARDDNFANLDHGLLTVAQLIGLKPVIA